MNLSSKLFRFGFLFLMTIALFAACTKDDEMGKEIKIDDVTSTSNGESRDSTSTQQLMGMGENERCFDFVYPLFIDFPDGNSFTLVTNEEGLIELFEQWENEHPDAEAYPSLRMPFDVRVEGDSRTIDSEESLDELIAYCLNEWNGETGGETEELCFDFVYPVTLQIPGGTTQAVNDLEELFQVVEAWYDANEDSDEDVTFLYPIQILIDTTTITINNDEELELAFEICEFDACFAFSYPITIRLDTLSVEVNSNYDLVRTLNDWYKNYPDASDFEISFPITVTTLDGEVLIIHNEEELDAIFEECYEDDCRATNLILGSPQNAVEQVATGLRIFLN